MSRMSALSKSRLDINIPTTRRMFTRLREALMSLNPRTVRLAFVFALALSAATPGVFADAALTKLQVYPPEVNLATVRDRQTFVVQAVYSDGITREKYMNSRGMESKNCL